MRTSATAAAVTLTTLPLLPSLLALLPKRAEQAILRSIKAHSLGRRAYNALCWHPHSFGRRQALRPWLRQLVTTSCVHVAAGCSSVEGDFGSTSRLVGELRIHKVRALNGMDSLVRH